MKTLEIKSLTEVIIDGQRVGGVVDALANAAVKGDETMRGPMLDGLLAFVNRTLDEARAAQENEFGARESNAREKFDELLAQAAAALEAQCAVTETERVRAADAETKAKQHASEADDRNAFLSQIAKVTAAGTPPEEACAEIARIVATAAQPARDRRIAELKAELASLSAVRVDGPEVAGLFA